MFEVKRKWRIERKKLFVLFCMMTGKKTREYNKVKAVAAWMSKESFFLSFFLSFLFKLDPGVFLQQQKSRAELENIQFLLIGKMLRQFGGLSTRKSSFSSKNTNHCLKQIQKIISENLLC